MNFPSPRPGPDAASALRHDPVVVEEFRPKVNGTIDDIVEENRLAAGKLYFKTRNIVGATVSTGIGAAFKAGFSNSRRIPRNLSMFRFSADVLQIGKFWACVLNVILETSQCCESGT